MTEQQEISDIARETLYILNYFNPDFICKIPESFISKLKKLAKESNIIVKIDKSKSLKEQEILTETKDLITLIYYSYIATEDEREEMLQIWNKNETLYQEKIRKRYNLDNIFKRKNIREKNELAMVEYKKNILQNIFDKIKKLLKIT